MVGGLSASDGLIVSRCGGGTIGVVSDGVSGIGGVVIGGLASGAVISGAAELSGATKGFACGKGIDPLSSGGKGPDGKRGVTRPELTDVVGAAFGTGASPDV